METLRLRAMNTDILLAAEGNGNQLADGFEKAQEFIRDGESRFTRFSEDSELSSLNRSAGEWFQASPELFSVLVLAQHFYHLTRGLFDPSILPDLKRAGYVISMDQLREQSSLPMYESLLVGERPSLSEMDLDESLHRILLPTGMALDLGGIAKGWIVEQAALILSQHATAGVVDAGGDMFLAGLPDGMEQWPVVLEDPLNPERILTSLKVDPGGVVTSTVTKRAWVQEGKSRHHIIDPRTGEPADSEWISLTVTARHAYEAEVYAKALLIAGPQQAEEIARISELDLRFLAVDREDHIWGNQRYLERNYVSTDAS